jgi:plastocyanin
VKSRLALMASLTLTLVACSGAAPEWTPLPSGADPPAACARADADGVIVISADELRFSAPCMVAPAGVGFTVRFTNEESEPHNVAIYADGSAATREFQGEGFNGPGVTKDYAVDALSAGEHFFRCDIHPEAMNGALYVR